MQKREAGGEMEADKRRRETETETKTETQGGFVEGGQTQTGPSRSTKAMPRKALGQSMKLQ
ncbi:hypothetical protein E4U42_001259 [Claviceps africana]|uniref:Uncharacterized protein n=1 Tax=Claviceps africana TaxID=83212 RepID=A0A8K0JBX6_9HYPO|nr:hypothetical protein E4U42_001259 [Claviceps africana]